MSAVGAGAEDLAALLGRTYRGAKVLVTGHTGFKGSWLTTWLSELGAHVTGFALAPDTKPSMFELLRLSERCTHELGDVRDLERTEAVVRKAAPDFVFHLAAQSLVRRSYAAPVDTIATNVMGTTHVLEAVRRAGKPAVVVVVSSDKCYENREWPYAYREEDAMGGHDPYSMSKGATELVAASYRRSFFDPRKIAEHGVAIASGRAGNVIGGGDWCEDRLVPDIMNALASGRAIPVRNPASVRPWQHVLEPLAGYLVLGARMKAERGRFCEPYNFGPALDSCRTVREMVQAFIEAWGEGTWEDKSDPSAPHEAVLLRLAVDKAFASLGVAPRWGTRATVQATTEWYRAHAKGASGDELGALTRAQIERYVRPSA
ncbi:MAG: CDP-glucose 4,6-dehydratase [Deltaproteobacteria bacterium]|nr:CDP-glucose 4,6-dehydratase [Deltaproteobacteria bacterium]